MTPEQIAADRELDVTAVKAALMQVSSVYRRACNAAPLEDETLNFSDDQHRRAVETIAELAIAAEDEHLRAKMATYIRDDKKGRKEVIKAVQGQQFNILMFNEQIAKVRDAAEKAKERIMGNGQQKMIEV